MEWEDDKTITDMSMWDCTHWVSQRNDTMRALLLHGLVLRKKGHICFDNVILLWCQLFFSQNVIIHAKRNKTKRVPENRRGAMVKRKEDLRLFCVFQFFNSQKMTKFIMDRDSPKRHKCCCGFSLVNVSGFCRLWLVRDFSYGYLGVCLSWRMSLLNKINMYAPS